ncbi:MAG: PQQ-like beta-propeller repeat protein, partial [Planctomycetes bacterium]|nr:PQQ-like beta-propeller repeat protein [Planctomycetota bacterium]
TRRAWLPPLAVLAVPLILSGCSLIFGGDDVVEGDVSVNEFDGENEAGIETEAAIDAGPVVAHRLPGKRDYVNQLIELPLRFDAERWHLDANERGGGRLEVREFYVFRDVRRIPSDRSGDTILVVLEDNSMYAFSAMNFTVLWKGLLDQRTRYLPQMTGSSIYFVDEHGNYQKFNRETGELSDKGYFGVGKRPSVQPVANDTHLVIPTSHNASVTGWGDTDSFVATSLTPTTWTYPSYLTGDERDFRMVTIRPVADVEGLFFVSNNNYLYGLSAQTGDFRFKTDLGRVGIVRTPPVLHDDILYVGGSSQLFAISRSGEILWTYTTTGPVEGQIYVMDDKVYFNTMRITGDVLPSTDPYQRLPLGRVTADNPEMDMRFVPDQFCCITIGRTRVPLYDGTKNPPIKTDDKGNPLYDIDVIKAPRALDWVIDNQGQRVLLKTKKYLFVLYEEWEIPYNDIEKEEMRKSGRVIRDEEFRVYTKRVLQVLDVNTGEVINRAGDEWSWDVSDFPFIVGSDKDNDRALYFCTKDGHIFKGMATD